LVEEAVAEAEAVAEDLEEEVVEAAAEAQLPQLLLLAQSLRSAGQLRLLPQAVDVEVEAAVDSEEALRQDR
jgi:hypothetical protein